MSERVIGGGTPANPVGIEPIPESGLLIAAARHLSGSPSSV
jgi:hypothetical protein